MPPIELPHTAGCLACGRDNPHGLRLDLRVEESAGEVTVDFIPRAEHTGFEGIVHGGALATVFDEAMVWAATWAGRRFCVCGEMTVRFRQAAAIGQAVRVTARVDSCRPKLIVAAAEARRVGDGALLATAGGKYVPVPADRHRAVVATLLDEPGTARAAAVLRDPGEAHAPPGDGGPH